MQGLDIILNNLQAYAPLNVDQNKDSTEISFKYEGFPFTVRYKPKSKHGIGELNLINGSAQIPFRGQTFDRFTQLQGRVSGLKTAVKSYIASKKSSDDREEVTEENLLTIPDSIGKHYGENPEDHGF